MLLPLDKRVFVVSDWDDDVANMFWQRGWVVVDSIKDANLIQFTGGEDLSPCLYNTEKHRLTMPNFSRDCFERLVCALALRKGIAMAGICRGGQLLNVLNGGSMWQHVVGHTSAHPAKDVASGETILVTSTHHQMMIPPGDFSQYKLLLVGNQRGFKERVNRNGKVIRVENHKSDVEALMFPETRCLAFQPHPEYPNAQYRPCQDLYFKYLDNLMQINEAS